MITAIKTKLNFYYNAVLLQLCWISTTVVLKSNRYHNIYANQIVLVLFATSTSTLVLVLILNSMAAMVILLQDEIVSQDTLQY